MESPLGARPTRVERIRMTTGDGSGETEATLRVGLDAGAFTRAEMSAVANVPDFMATRTKLAADKQLGTAKGEASLTTKVPGKVVVGTTGAKRRTEGETVVTVGLEAVRATLNEVVLTTGAARITRSGVMEAGGFTRTTTEVARRETLGPLTLTLRAGALRTAKGELRTTGLTEGSGRSGMFGMTTSGITIRKRRFIRGERMLALLMGRAKMRTTRIPEAQSGGGMIPTRYGEIAGGRTSMGVLIMRFAGEMGTTAMRVAGSTKGFRVLAT